MTKPPPAAAKAAAPKPCDPNPRKKRTRITPTQREAGGEGPLSKHWRTYFLSALIDTSNVTAAAKAVGVAPSRAYKVRREDPGFAAQWRVALHEGYQNLEMELLGFLRGTEPDRKIDVPAAIRLLTMHRETAAQARAVADDRSEQEVLASIDAMIDEMRGRAAANAAIIAADGEAGDERD